MDQTSHEPAEPAPSDGETRTCARCGTTAHGTPPTWTYSMENGRRSYFCDACARENIRAIEGRLDSVWW
ncbi:hypothetical protein AAHZ94_17160 [Streptomyces sp. HSW2009]|uniref:hypothetical protein n=1 Tax=Streptomyces sp. HSW2009 TaxID=3142890 RepID=UPI0032EBCECE